MKKLLFIICLFLLFFTIACDEENPDEGGSGDDVITEEFLQKCDEKIISGGDIAFDVDFPTFFQVEGLNVEYSYTSSNTNVLSNEGKITLDRKSVDAVDTEVTVTVKYIVYKEDGSTYESKGQDVKFTVLTYVSMLSEKANKISLPNVINDDIELVNEVDGIVVTWASNKKCLSSSGKYTYVSQRTEVLLTATLEYEEDGEFYFYDRYFTILVDPYTDVKCVELVSEKISLPEEYDGTQLPYETKNDYDCEIKWSCDSDKVDENGFVSNLVSDTIVEVTVVISKGEASSTKTFSVKLIHFEISHLLISEASEFNGEFNNTEVSDGYLVLTGDNLEGTYISKEYQLREFSRIVGSWNALTNKDATCEYAISVYANNTWSRYFSYGNWGLGKENLYYNQSDTYVSMNTDEIIVGNNYSGTKVRFMATLRRTNAAISSPKLARAVMTFTYKNYDYKVDVTGLPDAVDYELPRLYQHDVPVIGGSICSATTTSMLLMYHGVDLSSTYQYEHQYMASLVADPGHNNPTYGNWSYNMAAAGAFGRKAYVMRMCSWDELRYYLANNGPVGASIKGTFGSYTTGGHLIVVRGYRIENGNTTVICNDPNIKGVYYEVTLKTFETCWRNVVYIVE